jgi:hypothetical protein
MWIIVILATTPKLTQKKKKKKALKCLLNPNSKFQSLTTQFLSAKGEHRAIPANQIAIFLPSLPPVTVGLRVAQRPLQIRYGVGWSWAPATARKGPRHYFCTWRCAPGIPQKFPLSVGEGGDQALAVPTHVCLLCLIKART